MSSSTSSAVDRSRDTFEHTSRVTPRGSPPVTPAPGTLSSPSSISELSDAARSSDDEVESNEAEPNARSGADALSAVCAEPAGDERCASEGGSEEASFSSVTCSTRPWASVRQINSTPTRPCARSTGSIASTMRSRGKPGNFSKANMNGERLSWAAADPDPKALLRRVSRETHGQPRPQKKRTP
jgi:hypothetical protein